MRFARNPKNLVPRPEGENRKCGRLRCEMMSCDLGEVVDISATGMRVIAKRQPNVQVGSRLKLQLTSADEETAEIKAEVVWLKKQGWYRYEIGLHFAAVDAATRHALDNVAGLSMQRLAIADPA